MVYWPLNDFFAPISLLLKESKVSTEDSSEKRGVNSDLQQLSESGRKSDEGRASVEDDTSVVKFSGRITECDGVKINLPVGLAAEGNLGHLAGVMALVDSAKGNDGVITLLVGITQVESKDGLIQQVLVQHLVERRNNLVDGDGIITQTQNTVKATESKGKTRLARGLGKVLPLDLQVSNLHVILGNKSAETARAVSDGEFGSIALVCGRRRRIVLAVEVAGDGVALRRRNPEIRATGVEDDLECLRWRTDGDLGEVCISKALVLETSLDRPEGLTLGVEEVVDEDIVATLGMNLIFLEELVDMLGRTNSHVFLSQRAHLVVDVDIVLRLVVSRDVPPTSIQPQPRMTERIIISTTTDILTS